MVDLPTTPNDTPQLRAPTPGVSPGQIAQPYQELASNVAKGADVLMKDVAVPLAQKAGETAVTRDADGNLQVERPPIVGDAATAFAHALNVTAVADGEGSARRDDIALREAHHDDPQGYLVAADEYKKAKIKQYTDSVSPLVGVQIGRAIELQTTQTYKGLLNEQERLVKRRFDNSTKAGLASIDEDLTSLALSGDTKSPEFDALYARRLALTAERVASPVLAYPKEQADHDLKRLNDQIAAHTFSGHVRDAMADGTEEGFARASRMVEAALTNQSLTPTQRVMFSSYGAAEMKAYGTDQARQAAIEQKVQKAKDQTFEDSVIRDSATDNPAITDRDIKTMQGVSPEAKMRMLAWQHRDGMPEPLARSSQSTSAELFRRMNLPDGDPNRLKDLNAVREAYAPLDGSPGKLTRADEEWLEKRFKDDRSPQGEALSGDRTEFFKRYAATIDGAMDLGGHSALGNQKIFEMQKDAARQEELLRSQGKDPHSLYDPSSPNFLGRPGYISKFHVSFQDSMNYTKQLDKGGNLTGPNKSVTGAEVIDIPPSMSPAEAMRQYKSGTKIRLPDGRMGTVP